MIPRFIGPIDLAHCPHDNKHCEQDVEWGHPCDRDEIGDYICRRRGDDPDRPCADGTLSGEFPKSFYDDV